MRRAEGPSHAGEVLSEPLRLLVIASEYDLCAVALRLPDAQMTVRSSAL
jgi:hypothetical protein